MHPSLQHISRLQAWRGRKTGDPTIGRAIEYVGDAAARGRRRMGDLVDLWTEMVPPTLAAHTALTGFRGGVLQVTVDSAGAAFEIDRLLRSGLEADLRRRFRGSLTRVRTRIGPLEAVGAEPSPTKSQPKRGGRRTTGSTPRSRRAK